MDHTHNDGHRIKLVGPIQPNIGLDSDTRHAIVALLNIILADESVLATKTRSAQWNVRGEDFLERHRLFTSQYHQLCSITDKLAERAQMLGGFALGSMEEFLQYCRIAERPNRFSESVVLLADHETCIRFLREDARKCTDEYEDAGTHELLVSLLVAHEKMAWMLRSSLETEKPEPKS